MRKSKTNVISKALGANRIIQLKTPEGGPPLSWLHLAHIVRERLSSTGGRPSNPSWTIRRLIPLNKKVWKQLTRKANELSTEERKVSPAQLAGMLVEKGLTDLLK